MRNPDVIPEPIEYIRSLYAQEDEALIYARTQVEGPMQHIQIGAEEGKLLHMLIRLSGIKRVVEIGTLSGYSTLWMARALPPEGKIYTIEAEPKHQEYASQSFAFCEEETRRKITLLKGDATEVLTTLSDCYGMVFIDADKINYPQYLDWAEQHIVSGGLIIADNTLLFGEVYQAAPTGEGVRHTAWKQMRSFNERLADNQKYATVMIPTIEGLTIAQRR